MVGRPPHDRRPQPPFKIVDMSQRMVVAGAQPKNRLEEASNLVGLAKKHAIIGRMEKEFFPQINLADFIIEKCGQRAKLGLVGSSDQMALQIAERLLTEVINDKKVEDLKKIKDFVKNLRPSVLT